jgi:hypothetical protein
LLPHVAAHMDVNALAVWDASPDERRQTEEMGANNLKRCFFPQIELQCASDTSVETDPALLMNFQEIKTTWHPIGV